MTVLVCSVTMVWASSASNLVTCRFSVGLLLITGDQRLILGSPLTFQIGQCPPASNGGWTLPELCGVCNSCVKLDFRSGDDLLC